MRRIKLIVAYDGTNYCGWQLQPNEKTIEGELNAALSQLEGRTVNVIGASRTDSGVHALGNVAVFDTESRIPAEKYPYALNQKLPDDIRVVRGEEVEADFHPRHCDTQKTYEYCIYAADIPNPLLRMYSYYTHNHPDVDKMRAAAKVLVGEHDFTSFCCVRTDKEDKVRTIYDINIREEEGKITVQVTGNGFLYNMVRIIAGTLLKCGQGGMTVEEVQRALELKDRQFAGPTLPPEGLTLKEIRYL